MHQIPQPLKSLIDSLKKLPGVGPKTAQRFMFHILNMPYEEVKELSSAILMAKKQIVTCSKCFCLTDVDPCNICSDQKRNNSILCVVENTIDVYTIENSKFFNGLYFVLGGSLSPIENITPEFIRIKELKKRIEEDKNIKEIIISTNLNLEGETTAMYIAKLLKNNPGINITRIGKGLPLGASINFADDITLKSSFENRKQI